MPPRDITLIPVEGVSREFRALRTSRVLGEPLRWYRSVDSTNEIVSMMAEAGSPEGLVLVADVQSAGRGRGGNHWVSGRGGLWFSVLLRPELAPDQVAGLMPRAGAAVAAVLCARFSLDATVKHPNDVLIEGRKVCGILAEAVTVAGEERPRHVVLGVGLNVANVLPAELSGQATRLADHVDPKTLPERIELLAWLLSSLEEHLGIAPGP